MITIGVVSLLAGFVSLTAFTKTGESITPANMMHAQKQLIVKKDYYANYWAKTFAKLNHTWKMAAALDPETLRIHSSPEIGDQGAVCKYMDYQVWTTGSTGTTSWLITGGYVKQVLSPSSAIIVFTDAITENGGWGSIDATGFDTDGNPDFMEWAVMEDTGCDNPN